MNLVKYDAARRAISEARRVDEVKGIRDKAVAVKVYAQQAKDPAMLNDAIDIQKRAERQAGVLLAEMKERGERHKGHGKAGSLHATQLPPKLEDLGITKSQSSRWMAEADLSEKVFEEKLDKAKKKATSALNGVAKRERTEMRAADEARVKALKPIQGKFKTLVVDPPWDYEWLSLAGRASPGYATMTHDELLKLNVRKWAEDNCHMYLWVTNNFMTRGVELMATWGFQHKTVLTWRKLSKTGKSSWWGLGSYFRNATEHVLFGVRGEMRTRADDISTIFEAPIREHSAKPDVFYDIVRRASHLPAGEMFQREDRDGFVNIFQAISEAAE